MGKERAVVPTARVFALLAGLRREIYPASPAHLGLEFYDTTLNSALRPFLAVAGPQDGRSSSAVSLEIDLYVQCFHVLLPSKMLHKRRDNSCCTRRVDCTSVL